MKKKLLVAMTALLSVCCLSACGNGATQKEPDTAVQEESTAMQEESTAMQEESTAMQEESTAMQEESKAVQEESTTGKAEPELNNETISAEKDINTTAEKETESHSGADRENGTYTIEVETSSSMFKVEKAELTIAEGKMTAVLTMGGTGYTRLYMGNAEQAQAAAETDYISFVENADGAYTFTIPVEAFDKPIDCAAFSQKKEEWYERQLTFLSATLSTEAAVQEAVEDKNDAQEAVSLDVKPENGTYTIEVTLGGGSGKTTVKSPATITVTGDGIMAAIEWSSSNYDYMLVDGEKYLPVNTEGNSVFEIPVSGFDVEISVIGDTVAMSKPREIEYTLTFHSDTMKVTE